MPNYRRCRVAGGTYFFTVALLDRRQSLLVEYIGALRAAFRAVRLGYPFTLDAIVVLPEHLHCVWTLPRDDAAFSTRWRLIKGRFAHAIPRGERLSARRARVGERGIWQRRFWEHRVRDERDLEAHIDYIHFNPVKHGHAESAAEWRYSSFHRFVAEGSYAADWAASARVRAMEHE